MKRSTTAIGAAMVFCVVWLHGGVLKAQHEHNGPHASESPPKESLTKRMALHLPPAVQEGLKLTMREHLEAIEAIVGALARGDFSQAAALAHEELGFPKHHVAMEREQGATFPPAYHELAMAHHSAAEALGDAIPTKDLTSILLHLEQTIHACVTCHQTFRLQD